MISKVFEQIFFELQLELNTAKLNIKRYFSFFDLLKFDLNTIYLYPLCGSKFSHPFVILDEIIF